MVFSCCGLPKNLAEKLQGKNAPEGSAPADQREIDGWVKLYYAKETLI
jgi:hypothetical protein